ncbi:hypothetical protein H9I45_14040 [Polaribacter haliotis]|uniref:Lipid/polyisoprenoid-binding YceI-like domain-containing protein n=1 Tax=Polaribacter haliotis TaxID=1888915 RepID=A0A7L8AF64_9FLAO|nr:hypothetical protein [Polaribacter haliotis]QOD60449.1 hypothetical protein H9I45_14040 [Polaribacter haliotis]
MKRIKFLKPLLLFVAIMAFSNCEENGEIQFIVVDEFESNAVVTGLNTTTSFETSSSTDISQLLDNASKFVDANIEKVTLTLQDDYSGDAISGNFDLTVGPIKINQTLTLTKGVGTEILIPANASGILSLINSGTFPYVLKADFTSTPGDDSFTINLKFKVKATVE